jgi:intracellular septation protein
MTDGKISPWLKIALDLGPVIAFFMSFRFLKDRTITLGGVSYHGFILSTAIFVPLLIVTTLILWRLTGRLSPMQIVTLLIVLVFGGLSLWFNDERFFKMKPTIIYTFFAGFLGFGLLRGKSYLKYAMEEVLPLRPEGWMILTRRVAVLFAVLAVANEVIWRTMSDQAWVNFKTFGLTLGMFAFFMTQAKLIERYGLDDAKDQGRS